MGNLEQKTANVLGMNISEEFNKQIVGCGNTLMMAYFSNAAVGLFKDKQYFIAGLSGLLALTSARTIYEIGKEIAKKNP